MLNKYFWDYFPIFFLSIISGLIGSFKRKNILKLSDYFGLILSDGILGVIILILLGDFTDLSIEAKYAVVCLFSYIGQDEAVDLILKIKGIKK